MSRLEKLDTEQVALLDTVRDQWLAYGLCTDRADRVRAEQGARLAYEAAGLEPPKLIVWLDSPMAGAIGAAILESGPLLPKAAAGAQVGAQVSAQVRDQVSAQVRDQVSAQVRDQVSAQVGDQVSDQVSAQVSAQVRAQVWDQVWDQVGAQVGAQVSAQVRDQVSAQVRDQVWDQVRDQVRNQVWDQIYRCGYGQHDANWLSFYQYFEQASPQLAELIAPLHGQLELAQSAGWWWPSRNLIILTERPTILRRDNLNRLHNLDGPAIQYPDSWGIWAIHGVRVDQAVVEHPETLTVESLLHENNQERRRVMIEQYGWERFTTQAGLSLVHECADPGNPGQVLKLWDLPADMAAPTGDWRDGTVRLLTCTNGTVERSGIRRQFGLTVNSSISDALEAAASTYRMSRDDYTQLARRC